MSDIDHAMDLLVPEWAEVLEPSFNRVVNVDFPLEHPGIDAFDLSHPDVSKYADPLGWSSLAAHVFQDEIWEALSAISAVTGISFVPTPAGQQPNLSFALYDRHPYGNFEGGVLPASQPDTAFVFLGSSQQVLTSFSTYREYLINTILHEVGHTLNLTHPFGSLTPLPEAAERTNQYTVMAYDAHPEYLAFAQAGLDYAGNTYSTGLMLYDIAALQSKFGEDTETNANGTRYGANRTAQLGGDWTPDKVFAVTRKESGSELVFAENMMM